MRTTIDVAGRVAIPKRLRALTAHVLVQTYSVLAAGAAADVLARRFPDSPLQIAPDERGYLLQTLAAAGVFGGATYDGLVALEAAAHEQNLLTLDQRAQITYRRLGGPFRDL